MTHKCEYCDKKVLPCTQPCVLEKTEDSHICCKCPSPECELPERIVCDSEFCNLKYQVDWYKIKLDECQNDISKLKALTNQFRLVNIGPSAWKQLIDNGTLDITGIHLFVSKQRLTWDQLGNSENEIAKYGYMLMCLHEEFAKQFASFLNEKAVKVQIKKQLIEDTEKKLKNAQRIRESKASELTKKNEPRVSIKLNDFEKVVKKYVLMGLSQADAESTVKAMGMIGEARDLKAIGAL